ncbi:MAG: sugar ABC transporter ATP-binding protein [Verrucomicrobiota bacterium]|jgi:ABC-type sugar transport system ATPase subunit
MNANSTITDTPRLRVGGVTKSFSTVRVLHGVSFEIGAGEVLGIVGENGSGKSTLMNIIAGVLAPDEGALALDGHEFAPADRRAAEKAGIAFIQQELTIFPNLSVEENLLLGHAPRVWGALPFIYRKQRRTRAMEFLQVVGLDVNPGTPASRLSPGERQLLEIARGLSIDVRVMIFDEPTTSLANQETERLFALTRRLKASGIAILYVSHVLNDVLQLSDKLLVMRDGRVTFYGPRADMTPERLIVAMVGRSIDALFPPSRGTLAKREESPLLELRGVSEPGIVAGINLKVTAGEIVGISGLMGSGRTELARIIFGLDPHRQGQITANGATLTPGDLSARLRTGMAFLTEDRRHEGLMMDASTSENLALAALQSFSSRIYGRLQTATLKQALKEMAGQLRLKCDNIETSPVRSLSGGNQQKVVIGRWLLCQPRLLILDEPTRGVDVGAKEEIYALLAALVAQGKGALVISSEIEELIGLCDRILVMHRGCIVSEFSRAEFDQKKILSAALGQAESLFASGKCVEGQTHFRAKRKPV